jgi:hypothetical protein
MTELHRSHSIHPLIRARQVYIADQNFGWLAEAAGQKHNLWGQKANDNTQKPEGAMSICFEKSHVGRTTRVSSPSLTFAHLLTPATTAWTLSRLPHGSSIRIAKFTFYCMEYS